MIFVDETENVFVISDAKITADFILLNISGADHDHDLCLIRQLEEHLQLTVRLKARKNAGGMKVVKKLAAEFQIQLVVKLTDSFFDMLRLHTEIFLIIKTNSHN